jgi:hypothetical protein
MLSVFRPSIEVVKEGWILSLILNAFAYLQPTELSFPEDYSHINAIKNEVLQSN